MNILVLDKQGTFFNIIGRDIDFKGINFNFINNIDFKKVSSYLKNINLVISISYDNQDYNYVVLEAKKQGILTGLIIDGPLEWSNTYNNIKLKEKRINKLYQPIIHDIVYSISKEQLNVLKSWNPNKKFFTYKNHRIIIKEEDNIQTEFDVLITTATTSYFNKREKKKLMFLLKSIIAYCDKNKISYQTRFFDKNLIQLSKNNEINLLLTEHIKKAKCVLCTPSSVVLTSMILHKPTAQLIYRDSPLYYQSGWMIFSVNSLADTLNNMLEYDIERMNFQNFEVKKNISYEDINFYQYDKNINNLAENDINKINSVIFENNMLKSILNSKWNINLKYFLRKIQRKFL
jgi:hypothetical protein